MNEREQLLALCAKLGATPPQAATMADQLLKRVRAMDHLLTVLVRGRNGETVPGFEGGRPPA